VAAWLRGWWVAAWLRGCVGAWVRGWLRGWVARYVLHFKVTGQYKSLADSAAAGRCLNILRSNNKRMGK
jgi:hypothetical protein